MTNHIKIYGVKPRIQYVANGNLKKYEFPFVIFKTSDVDVYLDDKLLTTSEYEVSVDPDIEGGTISFKVAPSNGTVITIARNLSIERTTDFQEGGALRANVLNDELDYQIACQQQIADSLNRSMVLPPYAVDTDVDLTLPTPSAGKAIVWNSDGTNLENSAVKINELESTLKSYKESAESSACVAAEKATIASDKADTATQKADIASEKANEAVSTLASKANTDMDNLSDAGKNVLATSFTPSANYLDLALGNGDDYICPANGYFCVEKVSSAPNQYILIKNVTKNIKIGEFQCGWSGQGIGLMVPAMKNDTVQFHGTFLGTTRLCRFIYAQGEI